MAAKLCDQWHYMGEPFVPHGQAVRHVKLHLDMFSHFREDFWRFSKKQQYGCQIAWPMTSSFFSSVDHFIPRKLSNIFTLIRCSILLMQLWRHNEGTYDIIKASHLFPMRSTCHVLSLNFFLGTVSKIQRSKVFPFFQHGCCTTWPLTS